MSFSFRADANGNFGALQVNGVDTMVVKPTEVNFPVLGTRITGDFTNATVADRAMFRTNATNGNTLVGAAPNGTGTTAGFYAFSAADPTNSSYSGISSTGAVMNLVSGITGTGTYLPVVVTTGGSERVRFDTSGNVGIGTSVPVVPLEVRKSATGTNVVQRVGIISQTKNPYLEQKFDETNGLVTLNASGSSTPAFTFEIAQAEKMRIDTAGRVGIGITPSYSLDIGNGAGQQIIRASGGATSNADGSAVYLKTGSTTHGIGNYSAIVGGTYNQDLTLWSGTGNTIFTTAGSERLRITNTGNINIATTGARITGDFSNSTLSSRVMFQTSTTNSQTSVGVLPNGTGDTTNINLFASADSANAAFGQLVCTPTMVRLGASASGTAVPPPLMFYVNGSDRMRIDTNGNVGIGTSSPDSKLAVYSATGTTQLRFGASPNYYWDISRDNDTSGNLWISNYNNSGSRTTRMVIGNTGDINIPTLGARITGDFSNATISNRLMFQTNTTNGNTLVGAVPNGTGNSAGWYAFSGSDPSNAAYAGIASSNGVSIIVSGIIGTGTYQPLIMTTGGSERIRIDTSGNVGIGETNPSGWSSKLVVKGASGYVQTTVACSGNSASDVSGITATAGSSGYSAAMQAYGDGFVQLNLNGAAGKERRTTIFSSNSIRWTYGSDGLAESGSNAGSNFRIYRYADNGAYLGNPLLIARNSGDALFEGHVAPATDNTKNSGGASNRWSTVYAGTGTINTSDAREKNEVRSLTENEILAAQALSKEIGAYKFLSSIVEKGDAAREHIGMTVQRAIEVMESFDLNPFNYGFICYDEWDEQTETIPAVEATEAVIGANGEVVVPAREAKPEEIQVIREAGNRYSFRMDELSMFISRGLVARMDSIEAKLAALGA